MKIKVKFFAAHQEAVGKKELEMTIPNGEATVAEVLNLLEKSYPRLRELKIPTLIVRNRNHAPLTQRLNEGDELIFFPPVGGG